MITIHIIKNSQGVIGLLAVMVLVGCRSNVHSLLIELPRGVTNIMVLLFFTIAYYVPSNDKINECLLVVAAPRLMMNGGVISRTCYTPHN